MTQSKPRGNTRSGRYRKLSRSSFWGTLSLLGTGVFAVPLSSLGAQPADMEQAQLEEPLAPAINACTEYVDRTADDADRTLPWDFGIQNDPRRCIKIRVGQSVTFRASILAHHPIQAWGGDTPNPFTNAYATTSVFTFSQAGVFGFICEIHFGMEGAVWVVE